jgi:hypothetical protein
MLARDGTQWLRTCAALEPAERRKLAQESLTLLEYAQKHLRDDRKAQQAARSALPDLQAFATDQDDPEPFAAPMV